MIWWKKFAWILIFAKRVLAGWCQKKWLSNVVCDLKRIDLFLKFERKINFWYLAWRILTNIFLTPYPPLLEYSWFCLQSILPEVVLKELINNSGSTLVQLLPGPLLCLVKLMHNYHIVWYVTGRCASVINRFSDRYTLWLWPPTL